MSLDNFIPELWSNLLLVRLRKSLVYGQDGVINRDYEGQIRAMGDTVRISSIGAVTVSDYTKNTDLAPPEALTDAQTILAVDRQKSFNFAIDDIDAIQQTPKLMGEAMTEAAYGLRDLADQYIAGKYTDIASANFIGTDAAPKTDLATAGQAYVYLVDLGTLLTDNNVPLEGRFVVVPPWYHGALLKDDRFVKSGTPAGDALLRNGQVGEAAGFRVLVSQNVPSTSATVSFKIIAGSPIAWSFAEQVNKIEAYRPEKRFADAVKGLHLYGAKVTRSAALAVLFANKA